jgi:pyruvate/2-oxoglutarate dehydrogenase complex dihydrolipoamide acyltransferase (E2) component
VQNPAGVGTPGHRGLVSSPVARITRCGRVQNGRGLAQSSSDEHGSVHSVSLWEPPHTTGASARMKQISHALGHASAQASGAGQAGHRFFFYLHFLAAASESKASGAAATAVPEKAPNSHRREPASSIRRSEAKRSASTAQLPGDGNDYR